MKRENPAICVDCGRTIEHGVAPDPLGHCELCAESTSVRPRTPEASPERPESPFDPVVERLRERYHEARALVAAEESDPTHRGQLDWIFGIDGEEAHRPAALDARTSELVVLWLEDLIRHLDELADAGDASLSVGEPVSAISPGHRAARGLHAATREFADAFRRAAAAALRP
jgi:hypothetical protein